MAGHRPLVWSCLLLAGRQPSLYFPPVVLVLLVQQSEDYHIAQQSDPLDLAVFERDFAHALRSSYFELQPGDNYAPQRNYYQAQQ